MKAIKVINFQNEDGTANYKGLDINQFVGMSQKYDFEKNYCVIKTNEEVDANDYDDLVELNEIEYQKICEAIEASNQLLAEDSDIEKLKKDNLTTLEALAEMYEMILAK